MSNCCLSGSHFITDNNKSFPNERNLGASAFLPCKCKDHHLSSSCRPKSFLPVWQPASVALTQLRTNKHEPFLQFQCQGHCLIQLQLYVLLRVRFFTPKITSSQIILQTCSFLLCKFFLIVNLYFTVLFCVASFFLFYPFVLSFWIPRFPLRNHLGQKYICHPSELSQLRNLLITELLCFCSRGFGGWLQGRLLPFAAAVGANACSSAYSLLLCIAVKAGFVARF